ncbi:MAG: TraB/GumN family protein [Defluviitaleaceae bacterium]|nr:TraB/GumN family protein [Defluviitaleaceae bacterium]
MKETKKFLLTFFIFILSAVFAACGGSDNDEQPVCSPDEISAPAENDNEAPDEQIDEQINEQTGEQAPDEQTPDEQETAVSEGIGIHGLLSRIEYGDNAAYIFGSMHASRPYWFPLAPEVEAAMARSDVFLFETDMAELLSPSQEMLAYTMHFMMLPDGQTLEDFLPPDIFEHFYATLQTFDFITYEMLETFTPMAAAQMLLAEVAIFADIDMMASVDAYVFGFALENNRPSGGLNDSVHELRLMLDVSDEIHFATAAATASRDAMVEDLLFLTDAYATQNIELITEVVVLATIEAAAERVDARHMHEVVLVQRSIEFAEEIAKLLMETGEPTTFFVTMGIGHMVGYDYGNVFNKFESLGFEVTGLY